MPGKVKVAAGHSPEWQGIDYWMDAEDALPLVEENITEIGSIIDEAAEVSRYAEEMPFNYPVLVGEQEGIDAAEAFGADVVALPMTVFTDHAGRVIEVHAGEINRREITAILNRLPR